MRLISEAEFSRWLRDRLPGHVQRVESAVGAGIPDINICQHGLEAWIETKMVVRGKGVLLRKEQYAWGMRRRKVGGSVFVVALDPITDRVLIWAFPVQVLRSGKYLAISNVPDYAASRGSIKQFCLHPNELKVLCLP